MKRMGWRTWGGSLAALSVMGFVALISFDANDPTLNMATITTPKNLLGWPGAYFADLALQTLGLASIALLLAIATWGWRIISLQGLPAIWRHLISLPPMLGFLAGAIATLPRFEAWPLNVGLGGLLGEWMLQGVDKASHLLSLGYPPYWATGLVFAIPGIAAMVATFGLDRDEWRTIGQLIARIAKSMWFSLVWTKNRFQKSEGTSAPKKVKKKAAKAKAAAKPKPVPTRDISQQSAPKEGKRAQRERQSTMDLGDMSGFNLPQLDLLSEPSVKKAGETLSREALDNNARLLESVLDDFGIKGEITKVRPGPVVTLYELEPAPGTKSSRVIGLADDIARSMSAISARVAVVPGKNAIGIELPNTTRETVFLREILASKEFEGSKANLPLGLGKDIGGTPVVADLAAMPHLLVAGTTGAGKSVGINTMILSLLYRLSPEQCKFIMVDPKMLELSVYDGIPHLLTPVVTEPKKAVVALKWAVREMEERYRAMSKLGVRNIGAYNNKVGEANAKGQKLSRTVQTGFDKETGQPIYEEEHFDFEKLPYIVIVIDEMADLMLVAGKDVEAMVQRLAQMARAAGLHIITATQRPSVDVITGTIKANFPTRISFMVTSKIDSRTILGEQGAEQLLGRGDMLYMAGGGRITRVHGPFVDDNEVEDVVKHLKAQGVPQYLDEVTEEPAEGFDSPFIPGGSDSGAGGSGNDLLDQAVAIVARDRKASTSYIQRKLRIGYNRAADLIDQMEDQGMIGAPDHKGKREILLPEHDG